MGRILKKSADMDDISLLTFPGRHGSAIYLQSYLSTMFQVSDVLVDKDEVAMALNIRVTLREDDVEAPEPIVPEDRLCVSKDLSYVSKTHIQIILSKVVEILMAQGVACPSCPGITYRLLPLSGECGGVILPPASGHRQFILTLTCGGGEALYRFELKLTPVENQNSWRNMK